MELKTKVGSTQHKTTWRKSGERLLPNNLQQVNRQKTSYDIYPFHSLGANKIANHQGLVDWIIEKGTVLLDGYVGVFWNEVETLLQQEFDQRGIAVEWMRTEDFIKGKDEVEDMVSPFLGTADSVWGKKTTLKLSDFFEESYFDQVPERSGTVNIVIGIGAALLSWDAPVIYLDIPKNEIQYRMRAGTTSNIGNPDILSSTAMYKRFYFVDWVVLNAYKAQISSKIAVVADAQRADSLHWLYAADLKDAMQMMGRSFFRVRPWFEAGAWGGHWMQEHIEGLNKDEVNYAWSFEMIVPENGLLFESSGKLLEVAFDWLMLFEQEAVLGKHARIFKTEFPIRFDFLDTFDGGNLSIQCHPSLRYIREHFGEFITQDETYYILDCKPDAQVYLGFQDDIDPAAFRKALQHSQDQNEPMVIEKYVQVLPANKHDLFLIPNGTVHSAGTNNMVLEISATPYIFTFKMYDWMRLGLDGQPRPINITHAFQNLNFDRKGKKVEEELLSKPYALEQGADWQLVHLPTHEGHFYDVERLEFDSVIGSETNDRCHVLMLVEGSAIILESQDGRKTTFHYAETFAVPAAAGHYRLHNAGEGRAKVIRAFVKDDVDYLLEDKVEVKSSTLSSSNQKK
ncbi:class I mannose-6-phosphate isomerase [Sphingobacterium deserti]|uniref:Mannose-6-phosphate isomerase-like protein n=1 Tax=Sphingobacterium deserti TaxID=1229276 RepID=A0A0B8T740_9SPHI|nr:class I mannose-6-phosphate isomerase [Sphingobacterium deserti]KGE13410.1 mannose-6-phosphate isomerase-like protein [Sphingobacterium deserti]